MNDSEPDHIELEGEYPLNFGSELYEVEEMAASLATENTGLNEAAVTKPVRPIARERSLQVKLPELAAELHPFLNGDLDPTTVSAGARLKVWWMCDRGHEWRASVIARKNGTGCPVCARTRVPPERSLKVRRPELAAELHPVRNGELDALDLAAESNRKVWWRCAAGHEWEARVFARSGGGGCPMCSRSRVPLERSLAYKSPALAAELHPDRNGPLDPSALAAWSNRHVWWRCAQGHEWQAAVSSRFSGSGCPGCNELRQKRGRTDRQERKFS